MPRNRLVAPEEVRLPLSDGDYIDVKKRLNAGEYRRLLFDQFKDVPAGDRVQLDYAKVGISKILAYLLGWSFLGPDNQKIPYRLDQPEEIRRSTIDSLDPETYAELLTAVTTHETEQDAILESQKKTRSIGQPS